jgi:serine phosphatase RsbU (regulator of sigma subunit)
MQKQGDPEPASVFIVDDNDLVLASLGALLELETDYRVAGFSDPRLALEEARRTPVDVMISDYLMPGMNGVELLKEFKRVQPEAARILLTGFADKENAIRAINEVGLYQYLEKPWDNQGLLLVIRNAVEEKSLRRQLLEKVKALDELFGEHRRLAESHGSLEQELEMAARVQRSLLPACPPLAGGFRFDCCSRPCRTLGGDFYDFHASDERIVLLVADVSGHGAQAALTSMLLKASFQETAASAQAPEEFLAKMNEVLHRFLPPGMFVAATCVWLEPGRPVVRLSNAGLPYPFILRGRERKLDEIPAQGLPLGLFAGPGLMPYDVRETALECGDVMLIATDGMGDIVNAGGERFQDAELRRTLAALSGTDGRRLVEELVAKATAFGGGEPLLDDLTLVAVTWTPEAAPG